MGFGILLRFEWDLVDCYDWLMDEPLTPFSLSI